LRVCAAKTWQSSNANDPLALPSAVKRLAAMVAMSDVGMVCAAWYLKNIVPRIEPALYR